MSVAEALREAARRLQTVSDTARLDAELLMAEVLGTSRSELLLRHMAAEAPDGFAGLIARRERHEPVAYILGRQEFYGREFIVTPAVLIPRADSEAVVAAALEARPKPSRVLDLGVGSGALLLSVLAECPGAEGVGIDRSARALEVAGENAARLGLGGRARMLPGDWQEPGWARDLGQSDLVIANPPYVEAGAELGASVREWEPAGALFAGAEGLDDYRLLLPQLPGLLAHEGVAVVEIGAGQAEAVAELAGEAELTAELRRDLAGRPRALILRLTLGK
jgi:release factor glutamine methyltransferase